MARILVELGKIWKLGRNKKEASGREGKGRKKGFQEREKKRKRNREKKGRWREGDS